MRANYRLDTVRIEGFRGFTRPATIKFAGKSTFIFGPNGWGKSSILEAISWCLWGPDQDDKRPEIRNTDYYDGDCRVELGLVRGTERLTLVRKLSTTSGESDVYVLRDDRQRLKITEVLPQVRKLGGKGARVLFSQQGATLKWSGDLDRFKDVINAYLELDRLDKIRDILSQQSQSAQEAYDKELKKAWKNLESDVNEQIQTVDLEIGQFFADPPWEDATPPTLPQTAEHLNTLYLDVCKFVGARPIDMTGQAESHATAKEIEGLIRRNPVVDEFTALLNNKRTFLSKAQSLRSQWTKLENEHSRASEDLAEIKTQVAAAGGPEEASRLESYLRDLSKEEVSLSADLANARKTYEEAKRKLQLEQPKLIVEGTLLGQKIERLKILEEAINEISSQRQSMSKGVGLDQLQGSLSEAKARHTRQADYLTLMMYVDDYCGKYGYEQCPVCGLKQDIASQVCNVKGKASQEQSELAESVKRLQDLISAVQQAGETLQNLTKEKQGLTEADPDPNLRLSQVQARVSDLVGDMERAKIHSLETEQRYANAHTRLQEELSKTKGALDRVNSIRSRLVECEQKIETLRSNLDTVRETAAGHLGVPRNQVDVMALQSAIDSTSSELAKVECELDQKGAIAKGFKECLAKLKKELRYHDLLVRKAQLINVKTGNDWNDVEKRLSVYLNLIGSVAEIIAALDNAYAKAFDHHVVAVNEVAKSVYKRLTGQLSYPDLRVRLEEGRDNPNEIIMEVGIAERDKWRRPNEILNEQARHAVALVPYFAFSELGMLEHDLDFLLIDDPSQSFDTNHLEELISLLFSASEYAQVVLATHEVEKFEARIRKTFGKKANLLCVSGFDPWQGPTVVGKE